MSAAGRGQWLSGWSPRRLNFAHMAVWITLFAGVWSAGLFGGIPGRTPNSGGRACEDGRRGGCQTWVRATNVACVHGSGNACNQLGLAMEGGLRWRATRRKKVRRLGARAMRRWRGMRQSGGSGEDGWRGGVHSALQWRRRGELLSAGVALYYAGGGAPGLGAGAALFNEACDAGWPRGCGEAWELYKAGRGVAVDQGEQSRISSGRARRGSRRAAMQWAGFIARGTMRHWRASGWSQACEAALGRRLTMPGISTRRRRLLRRFRFAGSDRAVRTGPKAVSGAFGQARRGRARRW